MFKKDEIIFKLQNICILMLSYISFWMIYTIKAFETLASFHTFACENVQKILKVCVKCGKHTGVLSADVTVLFVL